MVDTDVVAAALLGEPETGAQAERLLASRLELYAPVHWTAELSNVVWKAVRIGRLAKGTVDRVLSLAEALPIIAVPVAALWRGAVARAIANDHPVYDTLFVELATRLGARVASFDRQLRERFADRVRHPKDLL